MDNIKSQRLIMRTGQLSDSAFILALLNQPSFYENIADKGIYTRDKAEDYIQNAFINSHKINGFGPYIVTLEDSTPIGMVGLFKRDYIHFPDIGYAFLSQYTGKGYATEACEQLLHHVQSRFQMIAAITSTGNSASQQILKKLGFSKAADIIASPDKQPISLYIRGSSC
jgi:RimJ/RimL family protein N-acetyltransferase